jgi:hypothetical protein
LSAPRAATIGSSGNGLTTTWSPRSSTRTDFVRHQRRLVMAIGHESDRERIVLAYDRYVIAELG